MDLHHINNYIHSLLRSVFSFNQFSLFGFILLLGLLGGEIVKYTRFFPKISGYIIIGFLAGPEGFNIIKHSLLSETWLFVDVAIGLILFDLGRKLDFSWLRNDPGLLAISLAESALTLIFATTILMIGGIAWLPAVLAGTIAIITSPAVVMMIAYDLASEGPVTRRTIILTSLNNLVGLVIFTILLPISNHGNIHDDFIVGNMASRLLSSFFLSLIIFLITKCLALLTGKRKENQFILFISMIILTISIAKTFNISSMLTLFLFGVATRNLDYKHHLMSIDINWFTRLFMIPLFVVTGFHLHLQGLWQVGWIVLAFLIARILAKILGIWIFAKMSRITKQQVLAIGFALSPMAGLAIGMSNKLTDFDPTLGYQLMSIITAAIAILHFLGPIATQLAFIKTGEASSQEIY